jgi:hypothetical protein
MHAWSTNKSHFLFAIDQCLQFCKPVVVLAYNGSTPAGFF